MLNIECYQDQEIIRNYGRGNVLEADYFDIGRSLVSGISSITIGITPLIDCDSENVRQNAFACDPIEATSIG